MVQLITHSSVFGSAVALFYCLSTEELMAQFILNLFSYCFYFLYLTLLSNGSGREFSHNLENSECTLRGKIALKQKANYFLPFSVSPLH